VALLFFLLVPVIAVGVSIHYLANFPSDFMEGLGQTLKWVGIAFLVILFIAMCD